MCVIVAKVPLGRLLFEARCFKTYAAKNPRISMIIGIRREGKEKGMD
jgi:hypothetical protein